MKSALDQIELDPQQLIALAQRESPQEVSGEEWKTVQSSLMTTIALWEAYHAKDRTFQKLIRLIFGPKSEKAKDLFKEDGTGETEDNQDDENQAGDTGKNPEALPPDSARKKKRKGNGRAGVDDYPGLARTFVPHSDMKEGDPCTLCPRGSVNRYKDSPILRFKGQPPVGGVIYELERLRCNACGAIFTASLPVEAGEEKYDATVGSMLANLKYGAGMPWYRLAKLQKSLGIPLPASTQWDITEHTGDKIHPVYPEFVRQAAQGDILLNDDTVMKILELMKENQQGNPERKGLFTSGVLSIKGENKIALFFTGRSHAGENLAKVLEKRHPNRAPPVQVSDALSRNAPKGHATIHGNCNDHARRGFADASSRFPQQCLYVIEAFGQVYNNDEITRNEKLDPWERLRFHCRHSAPVIFELRLWLLEQFEEKKVEPNSALGTAISYMLNHWTRLTLFLWWPGVPLSSCLVEQAIKVLVLGRKNFLFYRTEHGAFFGDMFMSIIHTCNLNGVNPFEYITALQVHSPDVFKNPTQWMPWNYEKRIAEIAAAEMARSQDQPPPA
jgi:hypothetical protein